MAASAKLPQPQQSHNSLKPRHGVVTLCGYGIQVRVDRGHLLVDDGIGADRRQCRLPRVGHELKRLVVIGSDGMISLAALRWLSDQNAAFVMLERDGKVLATTGPVRPSDAKLRRAQAFAAQSEIGLQIACELISRKLAGQEQVVRTKLRDLSTAAAIARFRAALPNAPSRPVIRQTGGSIYTAHLYRASEMKLQTPANSARRGVLDGDFFALFGNLINAVGDIGHVEFQIKPPRLGVP